MNLILGGDANMAGGVGAGAGAGVAGHAGHGGHAQPPPGSI